MNPILPYNKIYGMRKVFLFASIALLLASCGRKEQMKIYVFNPLDIERTDETVEVPWDSIAVRLAGVRPDSVAVFDRRGNELPSQVVQVPGTEAKALIFQVTLPGYDRGEYAIRKTTPAAYPILAQGRYAPGSDDYAWENNLVVYRVYGSGSGEWRSSRGVDVWCKPTEESAVAGWNQQAGLDSSFGEGLECYRVDMPEGSVAAVENDRLWQSRNYAAWETIDNGPLRTTVRFAYEPFEVNGKAVTLVKFISLDANSRFNRVIEYYWGDFERMGISAGMPEHEGARTAQGRGWIALTESPSELADPEATGDVSIGVVMPGVTSTQRTDGHWLLVGSSAPNTPFTYWSGSGWQKAGIASDEDWISIVERHAEKVITPLEVSYKK